MIEVTELLYYIIRGFTWFLVMIGITTLFYPVKMSLHKFQGLVIGVAYAVSKPGDLSEVKYIFFQIHLVFFSLGVFINLGNKK